MENLSIAEIYSENERINRELQDVVRGISAEEAAFRPDGENWSIAEMVEHVAIVESGVGRVCSKLLKSAAVDPVAGSLKLSENYITKRTEFMQVRIEAPEMVRPTGSRSIADSLAMLEENSARLEAIRELFERSSGGTATFPHPFVGEMSAVEWLHMIGEHKARHTAQIKRALSKIKA